MSLIATDERARLTGPPTPVINGTDEMMNRLGHRNRQPVSAWKEIKLLLNLAIPTIITQLGFVLPTFMTSSIIGKRYGYVYLDGFTLTNLTGNLCTLSILQGLFSASGTLAPQAFGAGNFREVGLIAIRALMGSALVMIPINTLLVWHYERILSWFGQDPVPSRYAAHYYRVYILYIPFYVLYLVTWNFLAAQSVVYPVVIVSLSSFVVLPIALEVLSSMYAADGAVASIVFYQMFQAIALLALVYKWQPHNPSTWPGLGAWKEALQWKPFKSFMLLGFGGMLAALEWVYWEALSLLIGSLGTIALSIHAIPTQIINLSFMIPCGIGIALSVRLGVILSKDVPRAKRLTIGCLLSSVVISGIVYTLLYVYREHIFGIFTDEPAVLAGCDAIWHNVCLFGFNLFIFAINLGIATGLGMQWNLGIVTVIFMWFLGLPTLYYVAIYRQGGIEAAWTTIWPAYAGINTVVLALFALKDWDELSHHIRIREGLQAASEAEYSETSVEISPKYGSMRRPSLDHCLKV